MSFRTKIVILLLVIAVVPAVVPGLLSLHTTQTEMIFRIERFQKKSASLVAEAIDNYLVEAVNEMKRVTQFIPFEQIPTAQLYDTLKIPYRQFEYVNIIVLLDREGGQLTEPLYQTDPQKSKETKSHEPVTKEEVLVFGNHIPLKSALETGLAFGPVYLSHSTHTPRVAMAVAFPVQQDKDLWVLAVELSLRSVVEKIFAAIPAESGSAFVVDGQGSLVFHPDWEILQQRDSMLEHTVVSAGLGQRRCLTWQYRTSQDQTMAGTFAPIPVLGWGLVIQQPIEEAFKSVHRIRTYAIFWLAIALVISIFGGLFFARSVSGPVRELTAGAEEIGRGVFDRKIKVRSKDEIGMLADVFNRMTSSLRESFQTISRQKEEIEAWNIELQARVDERTYELREAHEQILRSQKMAAVGELGAGMAHEINNPLTSIHGFAQIMLKKVSPEDKFYRYLDLIVKESDRIRYIVMDLLKFSQAQEGEEKSALDPNEALLSALRMVHRQLLEKEITVEKTLAADLPWVIGEVVALEQVFLHILNNANNAMHQGGLLQLSTSELEGGAVKITITDNGRGIPNKSLSRIFDPFFTSKDDWSGTGMGLSVAHQIIEQHHGKITVESEEGKGSSFSIILPGAPKQLHLT